MGYDLNFRSRIPGTTLAHDDFVSHFASRANYEVSESQAWYANEDTGVYFTFDFNEECDDVAEEPDDVPPLLPVAFNLNYRRPSAFGLEAATELAAFVQRFDLLVSDPQISGMGDGEYSEAGFLRGWNAGNAVGYRSVASEEAVPDALTLPTSQIESLWRWNFNRNKRQDQVGEGAFVPRVFLFNDGGRVLTGVAWADGIPILLPRVDLVLVPRDRLAPRKWLRSQKDLVVFSWAEIEPLVQRFRCESGSPSAYELFYETSPPEIERAIREKTPPKNAPTGFAFDQVLNRELLEEAKNSKPSDGAESR